jgi:hypothetical protein
MLITPLPSNTARDYKIALLRQEGEGWEDKKQIIGSFSPVTELVEVHLPHPHSHVSFRAKPTQYWKRDTLFL